MAKLTDEELLARNDLIERVEKAVQEVIPAKVSIYGSYASGMATYNSDIDLAVSSERAIDYDTLRRITDILNRRIGRCEYIEAKVPIIKGVDSATLVEFDMSFQGHQQVKNDISIALEAPNGVKELCVVLKEFLKQRCLNTPHTGGISGHILLQMAMAYFLNRDQLFPYPIRQEIKHSTQLLEFLETYGVLFNSMKCYIRSDGKNVNFYPKTDIIFKMTQPKGLITILVAQVGQSGLDKYKDISSGVYNWRLLRHSFETNFYRLQYKSEQGESILRRVITLDQGGLLTRDKSIILSRSLSRSQAFVSEARSASHLSDQGILDISDSDEDCPITADFSLGTKEPISPDLSEIPKVNLDTSITDIHPGNRKVLFISEPCELQGPNNQNSNKQNPGELALASETSTDKSQKTPLRLNIFMKQYMQKLEVSRSSQDQQD